MATAAAYDWHRDRLEQQLAVAEPGDVSPRDGKGKRSRQTYSKYQTAVLETVFQTSKYIVRSKRQQMSAELNLTERQIKIWFQNRRMKEKKNHKEVPAAQIDSHFDYSCESTGYPSNKQQDDVFACNYPVTKQDEVFANYPVPKQNGSYVGYAGGGGGYDLLMPDADPFVANKQQWPPVADFQQDFYSDHDMGHFQRMPMTHHHHHTLNSQVSDFCPPQLQAHGY